MGFGKEKLKQIRGLMLLGAVLILGLIYSKVVFQGVALGANILKPFFYGGAIAFVLNLPMKGIENGLLRRWNGKWAERLKRPVCIVTAILLVLLVINLVFITVLPQVTKTVTELGYKIPAFVEGVIQDLDRLSKNYPQLQEKVEELERMELDWEKIMSSVVDFLKNGVGNVLSSTVNVASSIIGGVINMVVAFIFALYVLSQKEKLADQGKRILSAYLPSRAENKTLYVFSLLHRNFSNFITGQCLEAVILGVMFVVTMTVFRMPYAVMVGVLIAFTALIPIVGAFIGCAVGAFLILIDNPIQALWFVILFLVLQQIEGNLIYPKVVGSSVGLPSIWVLMAVSVGGSLFGIAGMLFFIPLLSTVYVLLRESVNGRNRAKPGLTKTGSGPGSGRKARDGKAKLPERSTADETGAKPEKNGKQEQAEKPNRGGRPEQAASRKPSGNTERDGKTEPAGRPEQPGSAERDGRPKRGGKPRRGGKPGQAEKPGQADPPGPSEHTEGDGGL